jgi:response regulator RpfG family c-di-GMP phosphodiesterase
VPLASRLAQMGEFIEVAHRMGGVDAAKELARKRRGKQFDPTLADLVDAQADIVLAGLDTTGTWDAVAELAAEAGTGVGLDEADARTLRRAGLVHGFGRLGVSNAIWDKPNPSAPASGSACTCTHT